jgi:hypothetical protein
LEFETPFFGVSSPFFGVCLKRSFYMLKIYRKTVIYQIHSDGGEYHISDKRFYTIEDEAYAESSYREYNLYGDEIKNVYSTLDIYDNKRGRVVYVWGDDCFLKFKQWKEPNAKLIECVHYKEQSCSMDQLCRLPADKVIAYLKQEGVSFTVST